MKCFDCAFEYKTYMELADHILANTKNHKNSIEWASRYKAKLPKRMKDESKVYKPSHGICKICHKPFEIIGRTYEAKDVCQC